MHSHSMSKMGAFNTNNQSKRSWLERAALACDLLGLPVGAGKIATVSDVGCGDEKLKRLIEERGWPVRYKGFDLLPQTEDVHVLDLNVARPPGFADAAVALGVLEYVDDVGACLMRLAEHAPLLVVSHTVRDGNAFSEQVERERGWKNHLYAREFAQLLIANGWRILAVRTTPDGRTRLWLTERIEVAT